ncbi:hypothetical protein PRZ48_013465 [Zasmidium cellare]|uniref:N-acetyltransferase domain-containing protein n=1 Tax=Zasmidium cellare TaxID=395010 RepID=A0ABR0E136_ZASCE|nr:hypothetical protein PRZ48_013465 [Zasmidium cellare]
MDHGSKKVQTWTARRRSLQHTPHTAVLRESPLLPGLFKTIHLAYLTSDQKSFGTSAGDRLRSIDDLILVLRNDPDSFIIVLSQSDPDGEILSTASCRRYYGPDRDTSKPWACTHHPAPGVDEWELKMVATHPSAQGKGLASYMLGLAEEEVIRRSLVKATDTAQSRTKMIMCIPETTFAEFYARRGYVKDYTRPFRDTSTTFNINFISKILELKNSGDTR